MLPGPHHYHADVIYLLLLTENKMGSKMLMVAPCCAYTYSFPDQHSLYVVGKNTLAFYIKRATSVEQVSVYL